MAKTDANHLYTNIETNEKETGSRLREEFDLFLDEYLSNMVDFFDLKDSPSKLLKLMNNARYEIKYDEWLREGCWVY